MPPDSQEDDPKAVKDRFRWLLIIYSLAYVEKNTAGLLFLFVSTAKMLTGYLLLCLPACGSNADDDYIIANSTSLLLFKKPDRRSVVKDRRIKLLWMSRHDRIGKKCIKRLVSKESFIMHCCCCCCCRYTRKFKRRVASYCGSGWWDDPEAQPTVGQDYASLTMPCALYRQGPWIVQDPVWIVFKTVLTLKQSYHGN